MWSGIFASWIVRNHSYRVTALNKSARFWPHAPRAHDTIGDRGALNTGVSDQLTSNHLHL